MTIYGTFGLVVQIKLHVLLSARVIWAANPKPFVARSRVLGALPRGIADAGCCPVHHRKHVCLPDRGFAERGLWHSGPYHTATGWGCHGFIHPHKSPRASSDDDHFNCFLSARLFAHSLARHRAYCIIVSYVAVSKAMRVTRHGVEDTWFEHRYVHAYGSRWTREHPSMLISV